MIRIPGVMVTTIDLNPQPDKNMTHICDEIFMPAYSNELCPMNRNVEDDLNDIAIYLQSSVDQKYKQIISQAFSEAVRSFDIKECMKPDALYINGKAPNHPHAYEKTVGRLAIEKLISRLCQKVDELEKLNEKCVSMLEDIELSEYENHTEHKRNEQLAKDHYEDETKELMSYFMHWSGMYETQADAKSKLLISKSKTFASTVYNADYDTDSRQTPITKMARLNAALIRELYDVTKGKHPICEPKVGVTNQYDNLNQRNGRNDHINVQIASMKKMETMSDHFRVKLYYPTYSGNNAVEAAFEITDQSYSKNYLHKDRLLLIKEMLDKNFVQLSEQFLIKFSDTYK